MERLEVHPDPFVAEPQAAIVAEARQRALDDVPQRAQTAAVRVVGALREQAVDSHALDQRDHLPGSVRAVAQDRLGIATWSSARALYRRTRLQQCGKLRLVGHVR